MELLLSLQSADELRIAFDYSFRWLDLKNPLAGSLGCPDPTVASRFIELAESQANRSDVTLSIALGELLDRISESRNPGRIFSRGIFDSPIAPEVLERFDYIKVALANSRSNELWFELAKSLSEQLKRPSKLILVHYADHSLANAVDWKTTIQASHELGCEYILIDTFYKKAGGLRDWLSVSDCTKYAEDASRLGMKLSLAGSVRVEDFGKLEKTGASIIGIRGAACVDGSRVSALCRDRLRMLSSYVAEGSLSSGLSFRPSQIFTAGKFTA